MPHPFRYNLKPLAILFLIITSLSAQNAHATYQSIEYFAGQGPNVSFVVIDFHITGGAAYTFAYCYDEPVSGYQMLQAIADAGDLNFTFTSHPFGNFITNFAYKNDLGDPSQFWRYETATLDASNLSWQTAGVGPSQRTLSHRTLDGWYNSFTDLTKPGLADFTTTASPQSLGNIFIPEPSSLLLLSSLALFRKRKQAMTFPRISGRGVFI